MHIVKKYSVVFGVTVFIGILLLFLVSLIPQEKIKENAYSGRERFMFDSAPNYRLLDSTDYSTYLDVRVDDLMIDLSYNLGEEDSHILNPLVFKDHRLEAFNYGRYWHGYSLLIRPLLLFTNQEGITFILGLVTIICFLFLFCYLVYVKQYIMALSLLLASFLTYVEVIVKCLEYIPCMLLALLGSIYVIYQSTHNGMQKQRYLFYFIMGLLVVYFDFLTFETLTLTLPLLVDISINGCMKFKETVISCLNWVLGYVVMFITKFLLYLGVGGNLADLIYHIKLRTVGMSEQFTMKEAISSNLSYLRIENPVMTFVMMTSIASLILFVMGKECRYNFSYFIIIFIPIARYMALSDHSVQHNAFTYHALLGSIVAILMILMSPVTYYMGLHKKKGK